MKKYIINFWNKSLNYKRFSFLQRAFFLFLCFFELFYKLGFSVVLFLKKYLRRKVSFNFKIISIGNLSVGGTGKSVFVQFLINNLKSKSLLPERNSFNESNRLRLINCLVVTRGYKSENEKTGKSFLVSDGKQMFCNSSFCGDEAYMLAQTLNVPVVIGKDRAKSCQLLQDKNLDVDYVILDDAYQNFAVKKDFEILLLDARKPLENGHCLPAGRLREKDYLRARVIVLTHSDLVEVDYLDQIKNKTLVGFDKNKIFCGMHKVVGLSLFGRQKVDMQKVADKIFLVFAGIGSFDSFLKSVEKVNVKIFDTIEYPDHHNYVQKDLIDICDIVEKNGLDGAITTQKDWVKIELMIKHKNLPFYVLDIEFEFIPKVDEKTFFDLLMERMKME